MVLDNAKAKILIGQNVGIENRTYAVTGTDVTNTTAPFTTLERRNVALELEVQPHSYKKLGKRNLMIFIRPQVITDRLSGTAVWRYGFLLTRQLATLLAAGMPVEETLRPIKHGENHLGVCWEIMCERVFPFPFRSFDRESWRAKFHRS